MAALGSGFRFKLVFPTLACTFAVGAAARAGPGDIYNLGMFEGGERSESRRINNDGQVTGFVPFAGQARYFRYSGVPGAGGAMEDLSAIGGGTFVGIGINDAGQVPGIVTRGGGPARVVRYTGAPGAAGILEDLGVPPGSTSAAAAPAINNTGQVAGSGSTGQGLTGRAFRYTGALGAAGMWDDIGLLGANGVASYAMGINDAGDVVGVGYDSPGAYHAFLYRGAPGAGVLHDLGTLDGVYNSLATDVNNSGQVTGGSSVASFASHAFRYSGTAGGGGRMVDLGTLGTRFQNSMGYGINDAGFIVGWAAGRGADGQAALWRPDNAIVDLNAWLDAVNPAQGALWILSDAQDINDSGLVTGVGVYDPPGDEPPVIRAYVLDASTLVPEPGAGCVIGLAAAASMLRRRHCCGK